MRCVDISSLSVHQLLRTASRISLVVAAAFLLLQTASAQNPAATAARQWRQQHERAIVAEFMDFLAIPDVAADPAGLRRNASVIREMFEKRGVRTRLLETDGAPPVVYGEIVTPGAEHTLILYAHYDGQPVDPKEWATPPFAPVLRDGPLESGGKVIALPAAGQPFGAEWRIYARASGDDKAPIVALLAALDAIRENKIALKSNIRFVFEGEEEAGSPHLEKILADNKNLLQGDVFLICDGPLHQSRRQQLVFGVRGIQALDITVYGARRELHSGHYGNWAPNPAMMLAQLLASMKNEDGRVLIDHFYDGIEPLGEAEKRAIAEAPDYDDTLKQELWLGHTDGGGKKLLELLNLPSLNVRGISSGHTGAQASNVIPATATASIDMRLVKGIDHSEAAARVIEHVRKQGYFVVDKDPDRQTLLSHPKVAKVVLDPGSYNAQRTPMDLPIARRLTETIEQVRGPVIKLPTSGASLPLYMIQQELGTPTISIPIANHDDNQHTFNENLRMQNLWDGIEVMAAVLTM
ncbi:MAG TPA: M20/M25/M40 family metallo-hydrolase [Terriglobales bacterium]|nr:M20/M25/M40 family metallo-hydrolase [Terriglobales bacterium]